MVVLKKAGEVWCDMGWLNVYHILNGYDGAALIQFVF
jgi:hypothetical protein